MGEPEFDSEIELGLEVKLPEKLPAGRADALFLYGFCFHRRQDSEALEILVNGRPNPAVGRMPRLDLFKSLHPLIPEGEVSETHDAGSLEDPELKSFRSGFWSTVEIPATGPGKVKIEAALKLADGTVRTAPLAEIEMVAPESFEAGCDSPPEARVVICMATHNPDIGLLRIQLDSLRSQTVTDWVCLISDDCSLPDTYRQIEAEIEGDDRFFISRSEARLGFYRNFERALGMVPESAELVALCDQDDRWYPEKLAELEKGLGKNQLVYSDQRLVTEDGQVIAETYWSSRRNNHTNFASMLIANTVTGAASLFTREMLEYALPFPEAPGEQFHDHWLALVAMSTGGIGYVDRPLYDYVQHGSAVLGHDAANAGIKAGRPKRPKHLSIGAVRQFFSGWRSAYFNAYLRLSVLARVILARCGERLTGRKRRTLERYIGAERRPSGFLWLLTRPVRELFGRNETLGVERLLIQGILWRYVIFWRNRGLEKPVGSLYDASLPPAGRAAKAPAHNHPQTAHIQRMVRPLDLAVTEQAPERVNLLIPTFDLKHLFGGYIAKFNLARKLSEAGYRTRIVTVDPTPPLPRSWRDQVESYQGLEGAFEDIEIFFARDSGEALEINPQDRFVATTWWTAHLANDALARTAHDHFLYLIQEYEPLTFVTGSWYAMADATYDFPHRALFSTELLREFFRDRGYGVYREGTEAGDRNSVSFQNAITPVTAPPAADLSARKTRRLLFYARPEAHAARNMFEIGLMALQQAVEQGVFGPEWTFHGIGTVEGQSRLRLTDEIALEILPRTSQADYGELLAGHDLGLSLMLTPHPSLPPLEMASAGMLTVTNSCENKTAEKLQAISTNLITAPPTVPGVVSALAEAAAAIGDGDRRVAGSSVDWSSDWETSLGPDVMERVSGFLG
ncbi:MAG: glycosyltransferase [Solirubrobacterales bacterium]|nr:glycosyltransferase [Solirubrobacterales bacterium]